jgi:hypothetical protein
LLAYDERKPMKITVMRLDRLRAGQSISDAGLFARRQSEGGAIVLSYVYRAHGAKRFLRLGTLGELTLHQARAICAKFAVGFVVYVRMPRGPGSRYLAASPRHLPDE